jgi:ubiquinol-cytochrome c reductase cytochrome c1 subunit
MKRFIFALAGLTLSVAAIANEGETLPFSFKPDTGNLASVQRGARDFMGYCSGCHSMKHLRYSRIAQDLGISEDLVKKDLMFTTDKIGDHIITSMPAEQSKQWFGQTPPDLTVETRVRGADWVYSYLNSFYVDDSRPLGVNNLVLPNASMPHVLWELQGWQVKPDAKAEAARHEEGGEHEGTGLELAQPGKLSPGDYQKFTADLTNFMVYAAEPGRAGRVSLGGKVILYLLVLTALFYALKKEFWKDVH